MPLDIISETPSDAALQPSLFDWSSGQHHTGRLADTKSNAAKNRYLSGLSAEEQVKQHYERCGATCVQHRWRAKSGEVDLIFRDGAEIVFVEVKASKTHARAAQRLTPRQISRVCGCAEEYLATQPAGSLTPMRIEAALVDQMGRVDILANISMML